MKKRSSGTCENNRTSGCRVPCVGPDAASSSAWPSVFPSLHLCPDGCPLRPVTAPQPNPRAECHRLTHRRSHLPAAAFSSHQPASHTTSYPFHIPRCSHLSVSSCLVPPGALRAVPGPEVCATTPATWASLTGQHHRPGQAQPSPWYPSPPGPPSTIHTFYPHVCKSRPLPSPTSTDPRALPVSPAWWQDASTVGSERNATSPPNNRKFNFKVNPTNYLCVTFLFLSPSL